MSSTVIFRSLSFRRPAPLLSLNDRQHWRKKGDLTKTWRETTGWRAVAARDHNPLPLPPSIVDITLPVQTRHKRDPHNYIPTCKAIVDGLVDAGWWPDDNSDWVTILEPTLILGGLVTVTVRAR